MSKPERVKAADMYSDAYVYYQTVGNAMTFAPGIDGRGEIYYGTKAKSALGTEILYTTLGWKVNVYNFKHELAESLYYQLGGVNMQKVHQSFVAGYEYNLYKVSLDNIKARLGVVAYTVLGMPNSYITFDACTTTKINGAVQGGMTDYGYSWGEVYTTYEGIAGAANWSPETLETLYSYYNKSVSGLSRFVYVSTSPGIGSIYGAGSYCYGVMVTLQANLESGYEFDYWTNGYSINYSPTLAFPMSTSDIYLHAVAKPMGITLHFYDNVSGAAPESRKYSCNGEEQYFPSFHWKKEGYHQTGWNEKPDGSGLSYDINHSISKEWILAHRPEKNLYALWDINQYEVIFDANGGMGNTVAVEGIYTDKMNLKEHIFTRNQATLVGWGRDKDAVKPEYELGQEIELADLVKSMGLEHENNGKIILYAVWDLAPEIIGENIYLDMEDAKAGLITEEWLFQYVIAQDREDGVLEYGYQETDGKSTSFIITDYSKETFMGAEEEQIVKLNFRAIDSVENITEKMIKVYIVDMSPYDDRWILGAPRFISRRYYKNAKGEFLSPQEGGLEENSIWIKDETYSKLLDSVLGIR